MYSILITCFLMFNLFEFKKTETNNYEIFDLKKNVKFIYMTTGDSYFGYSLLLQKGNPSVVVVGSPKYKTIKHNFGTIYMCVISTKHPFCTELNIYRNSINKNHFDFFGSVLEGGDHYGDEIVTCAPNMLSTGPHHYINGQCFFIKNSTNLKQIKSIPLPLGDANKQFKRFHFIYYYEYAYSQAGISIHYLRDKQQLLIGAPGISQWSGGIVHKNLKYNEYDILPIFQNPYTPEYGFGYLGYSVSSGKLRNNSIFYAAGIPRGAELKGQVALFTKDIYNEYQVNIFQKFNGEKMGSYFGSSLLVTDLTNDGMDDVIVGAPMYPGKTWDEGCVYIYLNPEAGHSFPVKICGSNKIGSRFGTCIANIGDIDLNNYNDFAVSAPYEDDGTGAVYIYFSQKTHFSKIVSQRISPSQFSLKIPQKVQGFGFSISRGNDIDLNLHTDIAIGAYKSQHVFIITSKTISDYKPAISFSIPSLETNTTHFNFTFCLEVIPRNKLIVTNSYDIRLKVLRKPIVTIEYASNITSFKKSCRNNNINLKQYILDVNPIKIEASYKAQNEDNWFYYYNEIPFSHGCGDDDVCQTDLSVLNKNINRKAIILGLDKELTVSIEVTNTGETALESFLYMHIPDDVSLINIGGCNILNESYTYVCPLSARFEHNTHLQKLFTFDVSGLEYYIRNIVIELEVKSLGHDINPGNNKLKIETEVILKSNPFIIGRTVPEELVYGHNKDDENVNLTFIHSFHIGNLGPSPIFLELELLMPYIFTNDSDLLKISDTLGDRKGNCRNYVEVFSNETEQMPPRNISLERTILLSCFNHKSSCVKVLCNFGYLTSSETTTIQIHQEIKMELVGEYFKEDLYTKDTIIIRSFSLIHDGDNTIQQHIDTIIHIPIKTSIELWIYVASICFGLFLLLILTFILYKCGFFNREYREKLENEIGILEQEDDFF